MEDLVRPATEGDPVPDGDWRLVLESKGKAEGFIVASRREGTVYIHELEVTSGNRNGCAMLMFALRRALRSEGESSVMLAISNLELMDTMARRGFRFVAVLMEGEI